MLIEVLLALGGILSVELYILKNLNFLENDFQESDFEKCHVIVFDSVKKIYRSVIMICLNQFVYSFKTIVKL